MNTRKAIVAATFLLAGSVGGFFYANAQAPNNDQGPHADKGPKRPAPRAGEFCPAGGCPQMMLSPEAKAEIQKKRAEIDTIMKAELEKRQKEMQEFQALLTEYKEKKSEDAKAKLTEKIKGRLTRGLERREAKIAEMNKKLQEEKAAVDTAAAKILDDIVAGKFDQAPWRSAPRNHGMMNPEREQKQFRRGGPQGDNAECPMMRGPQGKDGKNGHHGFQGPQHRPDRKGGAPDQVPPQKPGTPAPAPAE